MQTGKPAPNAPRPSVLEIKQVWGEVLLDTKHFTKRSLGQDITIGANVGFKWYLLGIDMGWIPRGFEHVLPWTPPMWSEVSSDWKNDFYAADETLDNGEHTLFSHDSQTEAYTARVRQDWQGFAYDEHAGYAFEELVEAGRATREGDTFLIPMEEGLHLTVDIDGVAFLGQLVPPEERLTAGGHDKVDYPFLAISSFAGFMGLLFALIIWASPPGAIVSHFDIEEEVVAQLYIEIPEVEKDKPKAEDPGSEAPRDEEPDEDPGKSKAKTPDDQPSKSIQKQMIDREVVEESGIMASLRNGEMFSNSGISADLHDLSRGLIAAKGMGFGEGDLTSRGTGLGGGKYDGSGEFGSRFGKGKHGYDGGGGPGKQEGTITGGGEGSITVGSIDSALIDEVIKRNLNQIKYCYTRELNKDPGLGGKVAIKFVIANDGTVSNAQVKTSTMDNGVVESCIAKKFMHMTFPEPKGNGIVIVSYPFLFARGS